MTTTTTDGLARRDAYMARCAAATTDNGVITSADITSKQGRLPAPRTVLAALLTHLPADEANAVTDDLEAQVTAGGYGTARTSAGVVTVCPVTGGKLSVRLICETCR